jgi:hypothetical protein
MIIFCKLKIHYGEDPGRTEKVAHQWLPFTISGLFPPREFLIVANLLMLTESLVISKSTNSYKSGRYFNLFCRVVLVKLLSQDMP